MIKKQPFTVRLMIVAVALMGTFCSNGSSDNRFCPRVYKAGIFGPLNFTPAFTTIDIFNDPGDIQRDGLLISSFFNSIKDPGGENVIGFFEDDLVARIEGIGQVNPNTFDPNTDVERLTDLGSGTPLTVWPNVVDRVPDGILSFEAVVIPGGFHVKSPPGRLGIGRGLQELCVKLRQNGAGF